MSHATTVITLATATNPNRNVVLDRARTDIARTAETAGEKDLVESCTEKLVNDNRRMGLAGQLRCGGNRGYAMAALLVGMSVMAVLMGALLPVWTTLAKREKEAELIFRGNQYARAVALFQRKFANAAPPSIDVLVEQRFLRKKYKDPITNDDFQPLYANQPTMPGAPGAPGASSGPGAGGTQAGGQQRGTPAAPAGQVLQPGFGATGATAAGGIIGVTSKSKDTSLRVFNGRTRYNEWAFVNVQTSQRVGQPGQGGPPGFNAPNQRPGQGQQPSPFGQQPSPFGNNPNQRPGMPMQPPGVGTGRPPLPGGFGPPNGGTPFNPFQPQTQPPPPRRPPGQ